MEYIFLGNNITLVDQLKETLDCNVPKYTNIQQVQYYLSHVENLNFCIFIERKELSVDIPIISQLRQLYGSLYIVLVSDQLKKEDKLPYLRAGIDCMISSTISRKDLLRLLSFAADFKEKKKLKYTDKPDSLVLFKLPLWKRVFDIAASSAAILLLSPIFIATAFAIRFESKGPIIYKSKRVGCNYKTFDFYKFRSMYTDADKRLAEYKKLNQYTVVEEGLHVPSSTSGDHQIPDNIAKGNNQEVVLFSDDQSTSEGEYLKTKKTERSNSFFKLENDPRVTRIGHIIRKYSIDELPQLFNILKGDMSVVGNRPLPVYEAELLTSDEYVNRFMAPAGLTGLWQVEKRGDSGRMSAEERKQLDIKYAQTFSFVQDVKIIFRTFTAFVQKEDV